jgi:nucleoside-diphosphate-sugar epimerase
MLPAALVTAAAKCGAKAVVIAGSSAEYKASTATTALTGCAELETAKLYGASKAAGGIMALAQGASRNIPVGVLRLFNVFGPGEAAHRLLPSLLQSLRIGHAVKLSAGTQIRDFVYLDDACAGMLAAMDALTDHRMSSGAYNLATGTGNSVADFARAAARLMDADEALLEFGALPFRPDDLPYVVGDATRLRAGAGWNPKFTMEQGIAATIAEYQANHPATKASLS